MIRGHLGLPLLYTATAFPISVISYAVTVLIVPDVTSPWAALLAGGIGLIAALFALGVVLFVLVVLLNRRL